MKSENIADYIIKYEGGVLDDEVSDYIIDVLGDHVETENDGIGSYEYWGQKSFDKGSTYHYVNEFTIAVDITGSQYDEYSTQNWVELESTRGHTNVDLMSEEFNEQSTDIEWSATPVFKRVGDKTYAIYVVK